MEVEKLSSMSYFEHCLLSQGNLTLKGALSLGPVDVLVDVSVFQCPALSEAEHYFEAGMQFEPVDSFVVGLAASISADSAELGAMRY